VKARFRQEQALADTEQQLNCIPTPPPSRQDQTTRKACTVQLSKRRRLAFEALFSSGASDQPTDRGRRSAAVHAVTTLCKHHESHRRARPSQSTG